MSNQEEPKEEQTHSPDGNAHRAAEPHTGRFDGGGEKASDFSRVQPILMSEDEWDKAIGEAGVVYDNVHSHYYRKDPDGEMVKINRLDLERYLAGHYHRLIPLPGNYDTLEDKPKKAAYRIAMTRLVERIQDKYRVQYVGAFAGYTIGYRKIANVPVLVTQSLIMIKPVKGDYGIIEEIRDGMFNKKSGVEDWLRFDVWLKLSRVALLRGNCSPGVSLVFVGEMSSCKTLTINHIIRPALGGRRSDPTRNAAGRSEFNDADIGAELLVIDDKRGIRKEHRDALGAYIKGMVGDAEFAGHKKGQGQFELPLYHRLVVGCNPTPLDLAIIPPIDDLAVLAKMLVLRTVPFKLSMRSGSESEKEALRAAIARAMPGYLYHIDYELVIPEKWKVDRFEIEPYCNPIVRGLLERDLPGNRILELINGRPELFIGTKKEEQSSLERTAAGWFELLYPMHGLATNAVDLGRKLSNSVERKHPQISERVLHGYTYYKVLNPKFM